MALTAEEKALFEKNGFLLKKRLIPQDWIDQVLKEIENIHERMAQNPAPGVHVSWEEFRPEQPKRIKQLMHSELVSPTLNKIMRWDTVLDIVEDLIGPDIALYHSKLLPKCAGDGTPIPWHQDYAYWKRDENKPWMLNCQLSIGPATLENGCIQFVPGSHKWGLQEHQRRQQTFGVFLNEYYDRKDALPVPMDPGDGVFFGPLIIHGSAPNRSGHDRLMNTFAYNVTGNGIGQTREVLRGKPAPKG